MKKVTIVLLALICTLLCSVALTSCGLFGGHLGHSDPYLWVEVIYEPEEDVTEETVKNYIKVQYYDDTGAVNYLTSNQYNIVDLRIFNNNCTFIVEYNGLTQSVDMGILKTYLPVYVDYYFEGNTTQQQVTTGDYIQEPAVKNFQSYYEFDGWYADEERTIPFDFNKPVNTNDYKMPDGWYTQISIYAKWKENVTVNYIDGDTIFETQKVDVFNAYNQSTNDYAVEPSTTPTKTNYVFNYWSFEQYENYYAEWDFKTHISNHFDYETHTLNLYASYLAVFNIQFNVNGGEPIEPMQVKAGQKIVLPKETTKSGCEFACWSWTVPGSNYASLFPSGIMFYEISDEDYGIQFEAGHTVTVNAEWLDPQVVTEGLSYSSYLVSGMDTGRLVVDGFSRTQEFTLVIPSTYNGKKVVGINMNAFYSCDSLTAVYIPESVTQIGSQAFYYCSNLHLLQLNEGLTSIGSYAFANCTLLNTTLPESLLTIGSYAFDSTAFDGDLPSSLTSIGSYAFRRTNVTEVVIPETVTSLGNYAFTGCTKLVSVTLSSRMGNSSYADNMGKYVFSSCAKLTDVTFANGTTYIPYGIFDNCKALTEINLPADLTKIGTSAFHGSGLTSIILPESLRTIDSLAFSDTNLTEVTIPANVTDIGTSAFSGCSSLTQVNFSSGLLRLESSAFKGTLLSSIELPDTLYYIGESAFYNSSYSTSKAPDADTLVIPDSVTSIGDYAFYGWFNLTYIDLGNVKTIGEKAFYACNNIEELVMSDSVTSIGDSAFYGAKKLQSIQFPSTLSTIGASAFYGAETLQTVEFSSSLTSIGASAFYGTDITQVDITSNTYLTIGASAFANSSVENAVLSGRTITIENLAFYKTPLTEITVGATLTELGVNVFKDTQLQTFNYEGSINEWVEVTLNDAFLTNLGAVITFEGEELEGEILISNNTITALGQYALHGLNKVTAIEIVRVPSIEENAFYGNSQLEKVYIDEPFNVKNVNLNAFNGCDNLQFDEYENGLYLSGKASHYGIFMKPASEDVTTLTIHEKTYVIAENAMYNGDYSSITSLTLPDGLKFIGKNAFYGLSQVTELVIPRSVVSISEYGLAGLTSLERLTIPFVGSAVNYNAESTQLKWLFGSTTNIPSSLKYIEVTGSYNSAVKDEFICKDAFAGCTNVEEIVIAKNLNIVQGAFNGCSGLVSLTLPTAHVCRSETETDFVRYFDELIIFGSMGTPKSFTNLKYDCETLINYAIPSASNLKVILTTKVTKIESLAFDLAPEVIYYEGTMSQWNFVTKESNWTRNTIKQVVCSDGTVNV